MAPVFANAVNLQKDCPLFSKIPREIRDDIFDLVMTPHEEKYIPYPDSIHYRRPGFRHADRNLSTTLLRCCQLTYSETYDLPAKKYVHVDWLTGGWDSHGPGDENFLNYSFPTAVRNLHLFTKKLWLEHNFYHPWDHYTQFVAMQAPNLKYLKITLEYARWPEWYIIPNPEEPLGRHLRYTEDSDPLQKGSWGYFVRAFERLKVMELELETLEADTEKLDVVIAEAPGWRFPLANGKRLVFNPRKTKWEGWHGPNLGKSCLSILAFNCTIATLSNKHYETD